MDQGFNSDGLFRKINDKNRGKILLLGLVLVPLVFFLCMIPGDASHLQR